MTGTRIVVDGLWRCLCPAVDTPALLRAINGGGAGRPLLRRPVHNGRPERSIHTYSRPPRPGCTAVATRRANITSSSYRTTTSSPATIRQLHGDASARVGRLGFVLRSGDINPSPRTIANPTDSSTWAGELPAGATLEGNQQQQLSVVTLLRSRPPYTRELAQASTASIYAALRQMQDMPGNFNRVNSFAQYLVEERHEPPTAALFEALVRANCHVNGSAEAVQDMLRALREGKIEGTSGLFHAALSVLAVHPDYILRDAVLNEMKERWVDLAPDGKQSVALGLLRDGQYERALNFLDEMTEASSTAGAATVPSWLLDIYIYVLGLEGFLDDALQIVNHRLLRDDDTLSLNVWSFLLDACCRAGHFGGLTYVWNRVVKPGGNGLVTPSDAMALDVLNMAAQHGDANLAAAVMQMLAARGTKLSMPHFEAMLDCYAQAGAIDKALQALCIMNNAGIVPDQGTTRAIFLRLTAPPTTAPRNPVEQRAAQAAAAATLDSAVATLFDLKRQYGSVPVAAFNVVLESMLASQRHHQQAIAAMVPARAAKKADIPPPENTAEAEAGLDLYRHIRQLCPDGPTRATFRLLFRACTDPLHLNFLVREMRSFNFRPDMEMIDQAVYANTVSGTLDQALHYVFDLIKGGNDTAKMWISRRTAAALAKRCIEEQDQRIWTVADASRDRGRPMDNILREAMNSAKRPNMAAHNAYGVPHSVDVDGGEPASQEEASISG